METGFCCVVNLEAEGLLDCWSAYPQTKMTQLFCSFFSVSAVECRTWHTLDSHCPTEQSSSPLLFPDLLLAYCMTLSSHTGSQSPCVPIPRLKWFLLAYFCCCCYPPGSAPLGTRGALHLGCLWAWPFKGSFLPLVLALALGRWRPYLFVPRK